MLTILGRGPCWPEATWQGRSPGIALRTTAQHKCVGASGRLRMHQRRCARRVVEVELGEPCQHRHGGAWLKESKLDPVPRQCPDADGRPRMRSSGACAGCFRPGAWCATSAVDGKRSAMRERMCLDFGRSETDGRTHTKTGQTLRDRSDTMTRRSDGNH